MGYDERMRGRLSSNVARHCAGHGKNKAMCPIFVRASGSLLFSHLLTLKLRLLRPQRWAGLGRLLHAARGVSGRQGSSSRLVLTIGDLAGTVISRASPRAERCRQLASRRQLSTLPVDLAVAVLGSTSSSVARRCSPRGLLADVGHRRPILVVSVCSRACRSAGSSAAGLGACRPPGSCRSGRWRRRSVALEPAFPPLLGARVRGGRETPVPRSTRQLELLAAAGRAPLHQALVIGWGHWRVVRLLVTKIPCSGHPASSPRTWGDGAWMIGTVAAGRWWWSPAWGCSPRSVEVERTTGGR